MGWIETPAPEKAGCIFDSCEHAPAVCVFVFKRAPMAPKPLCVEHLVSVLQGQFGCKDVIVRKVRW
jgi:hypothetical protein